MLNSLITNGTSLHFPFSNLRGEDLKVARGGDFVRGVVRLGGNGGECKFRFSHRHDEFYETLLKSRRKMPIKLS